MTSLRYQHVKSICQLHYQIHCYFCWENMTQYSTKYNSVFVIFTFKILVYETLTNDVVSFEQQAPEKKKIEVLSLLIVLLFLR